MKAALAYAGGLALFIAFTGYGRTALNADALIVYLVSLVRWTPYYWGQDRYGMLIPWLVQPFTEPFANVIAQNTLHMTGTFLSFALAARLIYPGSRWVTAGLIGVLALLAFCGSGDLGPALTPWQIYSPALTLGLGAAVLAQERKGAAALAAALVCAVLAHWCNLATGLAVGGILAGAFMTRRAVGVRPPLWPAARALLVLALGMLAGELIRRPFRPVSKVDYDSFATSPDWMWGWWLFLKDQAQSSVASLAVFLVPAVALLVALGWRARRSAGPEVRSALAGAVGAFVGVAAYTALAGASLMAEVNHYPHRYLWPALVLMTAASAGLSTQLASARPPGASARRAPCALFLACLVAAWARFGLPSTGAARDGIIASLGPYGADAAAFGCTHAVGNYYKAWPAEFYTRMTGASVIWGVSHRSEVTQDLWDLKRFPNARICVWPQDAYDTDGALRAFAFPPLHKVGEAGAIVVLSP